MRILIAAIIFCVCPSLTFNAQSQVPTTLGSSPEIPVYSNECLDDVLAYNSAIPSCMVVIYRRITFEAVIASDPTPVDVSFISDSYERNGIGSRPTLSHQVSILSLKGKEQFVYFDDSIATQIKDKLIKNTKARFYAYALWYTHHDWGLVMIIERVETIGT